MFEKYNIHDLPFKEQGRGWLQYRKDLVTQFIHGMNSSIVTLDSCNKAYAAQEASWGKVCHQVEEFSSRLELDTSALHELVFEEAEECDKGWVGLESRCEDFPQFWSAFITKS